MVFRDTKNGENRKVVLTKELTGFLKKVINIGSFSEYIFCHKNGQPLKSFDGAFRAFCKRAGINNFRFHDLRHNYCIEFSYKRSIFNGDLRNIRQNEQKKARMTRCFAQVCHLQTTKKKASQWLDCEALYFMLPRDKIERPVRRLEDNLLIFI